MTPSAEVLAMHQGDLRNLGTRQRFYYYGGYRGSISAERKLHRLLARVYKVGAPQDSLQAFVYRIEDKQQVWVPLGQPFYSLPLPAQRLSSDKDQGAAVFEFDPPLVLPKGACLFMIFRTGQPDDEHFYRIHGSSLGIL
jgi:hypothetical protein